MYRKSYYAVKDENETYWRNDVGSGLLDITKLFAIEKRAEEYASKRPNSKVVKVYLTEEVTD